jgi:hypothetical protein
MADFIWLVRGFSEITDYLFECNLVETGRGNHGCMEYEFKCFEDLFEAVRVLEAQPVVKEVPFFAMPNTPSYRPLHKGSAPQKIKLREVEDKRLVENAIGSHLLWIEDNTRVNMQKGLERVAKLKDVNDVTFDNGSSFRFISLSSLFRLCTHICIVNQVRLKGTYATHAFDFLYKNLNYQPGSCR